MTSWFQQTKGPGIQGDAPAEGRNTVQALKEVAEQIEKMRAPTGKKDAPGITCRDIALADPGLRNGYYWIDPNGHGIADAIKVFCKMRAEKTQTCLESSTFEFESKHWALDVLEGGVASFAGSNLEQSSFDYGSHRAQIKVLRHHSDNGKQKITLTCSGKFPVHKNLALFTFKGEPTYKYKVKKNDCKKAGDSGEVVLEMTGPYKLMHLPFMDVGFKKTMPTTEFGVKINRACFWSKGGARRK